jgi:hypothetical protein
MYRRFDHLKREENDNLWGCLRHFGLSIVCCIKSVENHNPQLLSERNLPVRLNIAVVRLNLSRW